LSPRKIYKKSKIKAKKREEDDDNTTSMERQTKRKALL